MASHGASLEAMFQPESVALLGASATHGKSGNNILKNLLQGNFTRGLYPINPNHAEILGIETFPSIVSLPRVAYPIDLAVICLPPAHVHAAFKECCTNAVNTMIIESGQLAETPAASEECKRAMLLQLSKMEHRPLVLGPNSIGIIDFNSRTNTSLIPFEELPVQASPGIAIAGQTGLIASGYLQRILARDLFPVSKVICLGNKMDMNEKHVLEYLTNDPSTGAIFLYLEDARSGRDFMMQGRQAIKVHGKPIFILKSGRSKAGAQMVTSHTGSIAGDDRIFSAVLKSTGMQRVANFEEFWDMGRFLHAAGIPRGKNIAIVSISGAGCALSLDAAELYHLQVPPLSRDARKAISKLFPNWFAFTNPIDSWAAIERNGSEVAHAKMLEILYQEPLDGILLVTLAMPESLLDWADIALRRQEHPNVPLMLALLGGHDDLIVEWHEKCKALSIPVYASPDHALRDFSRAFNSLPLGREGPLIGKCRPFFNVGPAINGHNRDFS
ncbi:hypothetical protein GF325_16950 [Candidatus Bathyarchaeota archaeon]|nr:hypothetical protein [Candidatus Bathyarchaeota archaeon]